MLVCVLVSVAERVFVSVGGTVIVSVAGMRVRVYCVGVRVNVVVAVRTVVKVAVMSGLGMSVGTGRIRDVSRYNAVILCADNAS